MVGRPERTHLHKPPARRKVSRNALYFGNFQGFFLSHLRKDPGDPGRDHALAASRFPDHQEIMAAGCGQDDGVQQVPLPFYLRKVRGAAENALLFCLFADASFYPPALKQAHGIIECMEAVYLDIPIFSASRRLAAGTHAILIPHCLAAVIIERTPVHGRILPSRDNSPMNT